MGKNIGIYYNAKISRSAVFCTQSKFFFFYNFLVSGDANFSIKRTSLTVGGFNQPYVARSLIELPGNAEKGLSQRFLWMFPKPVYGHFDTMEPPDDTFLEKIGRKIFINRQFLCCVV